MRGIVKIVVSLAALPALAAGKKDTPQFRAFPPGFQWCVATSHQQIEGNSQNDFYDFERQPGRIADNQVTGVAVDHWNRVEEDTQLQKNLGNQEYRMSLDWARIEPEEGKFNEDAIRAYRQEIELLLKAGIQPSITLSHFTFPKWVMAKPPKGGWEWAGLPDAFARFAKLAFERIAPEAKDWYSVNEPMVTIMGGYVNGDLPPGETRELRNIRDPMIGLLKTHAAAYRALHEAAAKAKDANGRPRQVRVGVAQHLRAFKTANPFDVVDHIAAGAAAESWNWSLLSALETGHMKLAVPTQVNINEDIPGLAGTQDFIGVNYYSGDRFHASLLKRTAGPLSLNKKTKTDTGWDIDAKAFYNTVMQVKKRFTRESKNAEGKKERRSLPIKISENGVADERDILRKPYIRDHLYWLHRAIQEGAPVEGYCHWSLLDNYEWREGWHAPFGLYEVDMHTQERTLRPSGEYFKDIIARNGLTVADSEIGKYPKAPERPKGDPKAQPWDPAKSRVFRNDSGCTMVLEKSQNSLKQAVTRVHLVNGGFATAPAEGLITIRDSDGMIVGGPGKCQDRTPWQLVQSERYDSGREKRSFNCGGHLDHLAVQLKFIAGSGRKLDELSFIDWIDYSETTRENLPDRNITNNPGAKYKLPRNLATSFRCKDLRLVTDRPPPAPGAAQAADRDDQH